MQSLYKENTIPLEAYPTWNIRSR